MIEYRIHQSLKHKSAATALSTRFATAGQEYGRTTQHKNGENIKKKERITFLIVMILIRVNPTTRLARNETTMSVYE